MKARIISNALPRGPGKVFPLERILMTVLNELLPADQLGFGLYYSPQMIVSKFAKDQWEVPRLTRTENFSLHPATKALHYAQEIFEGLKAYRHPNEKIVLFRPRENILRMARSAEILSMPSFPEELYLKALKDLLEASKNLIPDNPGALYLRPTMIATTPTLGVQPATEYLFYILASPVGGYFGTAHADKPVQISVLATTEYVRAVRGGIGAAKTGGNYAASLRAIQSAKKQAFNNVLFLDALNQKSLEELGGMNIFVVKNNELLTPALNDSILAGVTRDSILKLAKHKGLSARETQIEINDVIQGIKDQSVSEVFACGTAAVVSSVRELGWQGQRFKVSNGEIGPVTLNLFQELTSIYYGHKQPPDPEWIIST